LRRAAATLLLVALLAMGCGGGDDQTTQVPERGALTIYSSLPLRGERAQVASAVAAAQRLALQDHGGHAGGREIKFVQLDSSKRDGASWDPGLVEANAKRAADDPNTIAYLGELDYGGSAVSVPVTNNKSILQVSPYDGLTSLTELQPGGPRSAGPERYYPSGKRTFARLVPNDLAQAAILVDWAREDGAQKIAVVHDDRVYGRALAAQLVFMADLRKLQVTSVHEVDLRSKPEKYADIAKQIAGDDPVKAPDAVIYAGLDDMTADPMLAAVEQASPGARLYASAGVTSPEFDAGGTPEVKVVSPARPSADYPAGAQALLKRLRAVLGSEPPTEALYGYESMRLVLDAIDRAGPKAGNRAAVTAEALRGDGDGGPLGPLNLTRNGDVGDQKLALYVRTPTGLEFRTLRAPELPPPAALNGEAEK
jgi:branched-chain amino acid transport system substrate-binding protein